MLRNAGRAKSGSDSLKDAIDAANFLAASVSRAGGARLGQAGTLLIYAPHAPINVVQSLLYRDAWEFGLAPLPVRDILSVAELPWHGPAICHFHWLAPLTYPDGKRPVAQRVVAFGQMLAALKRQNRKIIWTVHNILPHDAVNVEAAIEVRRIIAQMADAIHIMNPDTVAAAEEYFSLADRPVFYSPHPSYVGAYPDYTTRENARFQLGIEPDAIVFLCFGGIQPYKGVEEFVDAGSELQRLRPDVRMRFVICGPPQNPETVRRLTELAGLRDDLIVHPVIVEAHDVHYYFRAADFAVCPYRASLNSGAAMLALTFGVPVVAPAIGVFPHLIGKTTGILYSPREEAGLVGAMAQAAANSTAFSASDCREIANRARPAVASHRFFDALLDMPGFRSG